MRRLWLQTAHQRLITLALYQPLDSASGTSTPSSTPTPQHIARTLPLLVKYLDTFHTDADGWSLLADLYLLLSGWDQLDEAYAKGQIVQKYFTGAETGEPVPAKARGDQYLQQAMTCLAHRMTLEPWDWMTMTRYGETALMFGYVSGRAAVHISRIWLMRCVGLLLAT